MTFAKKSRIKKSEVVGRRFFRNNTQHLTLLTRDNDLGNNRFAFVISKKVSKLAVVRNRFKRRLSAYINAVKTESEHRPKDVVIIVKPSFTQLTRKQQQSLVKDLFI